MIEMPPELDRAWHARGYYGSVNHNVKAIYQRYLGWYDANPAHLWQHPPEAAGTRYVQAFGGVDATVAKAREFVEQGDLRFAAELASHAVFAEPGDPPRGSCSPRSWSGWATGRRTRPGATATSPAPASCGRTRSSTPRSAARAWRRR